MAVNTLQIYKLVETFDKIINTLSVGATTIDIYQMEKYVTFENINAGLQAISTVVNTLSSFGVLSTGSVIVANITAATTTIAKMMRDSETSSGVQTSDMITLSGNITSIVGCIAVEISPLGRIAKGTQVVGMILGFVGLYNWSGSTTLKATPIKEVIPSTVVEGTYINEQGMLVLPTVIVIPDQLKALLSFNNEYINGTKYEDPISKSIILVSEDKSKHIIIGKNGTSTEYIKEKNDNITTVHSNFYGSAGSNIITAQYQNIIDNKTNHSVIVQRDLETGEAVDAVYQDAQGNQLEFQKESFLKDYNDNYYAGNGHNQQKIDDIAISNTSMGTERSLQRLGEVASIVNNVYSLVQAIQSGRVLPIVTSGISLAQQLTSQANLSATAAGTLNTLGNISSILSFGQSIQNLSRAIKSGDGLQIAAASISTTIGAAAAYNGLNGLVNLSQGVAQTAPTLYGVNVARNIINNPYLPAALAFINAAMSFRQDNLAGYVSGSFSLGSGIAFIMGSNPLGIVLGVAATVLGEMLKKEPNPQADLIFTNNADGTLNFIIKDDVDGGREYLSSIFTSINNSLNESLTNLRGAYSNPNLVYISARMPFIQYNKAHEGGLRIWDKTGVIHRYQGVFTVDGKPSLPNVIVDESLVNENWIEHLQSEMQRYHVLAQKWELETANMQTSRNLIGAGLDEVGLATINGKTVAINQTNGTTLFKPIIVDLDNSHAYKVVQKENSSIVFDINSSGYQNKTDWIAKEDGFLTINRDGMNQADNASELFSTASIDQSLRGIEQLRWADANGDGIIDVNDPVFKHIGVWVDKNQNGTTEDGTADNEWASLEEMGFKSIDINNKFIQKNDGSRIDMWTGDLTAEANGIAPIRNTDGSVYVFNSDGTTTVIPSITQENTTLNPAGDAFTILEDSEVNLTAITNGLLSNDSYAFAGYNNTSLKIDEFKLAQNGTIITNSSGDKIFKPNANFNGLAGFDYVVSSPTGTKKDVHVNVNITAVNDAISSVSAGFDTVSVYGYNYDGVENYSAGMGYTEYEYVVTESSEWKRGSGIYKNITSPTSTYLKATGKINVVDIDDTKFTYNIIFDGYRNANNILVKSDYTFNSSTLTINSGTLSIDQNGNFTNTSSGKDILFKRTAIVRVTDSAGNYKDVNIDYNQYGIQGGGDGGLSGDPIILDMANNGIKLQNAKTSSAYFDMLGDGWQYQTGWTTANSDDAILAIDNDGNNKIDNYFEVAFKKYDEKAKTDLDGLKAFDTNKNGLIDSGDKDFSKFRVWNDKNANGISEAGELQTLTQAGLTEINLSSNNNSFMNEGNKIHGTTTSTLNGAKIATWDASLAIGSNIRIPNIDGSYTFKQRKISGLLNTYGTPQFVGANAQLSPVIIDILGNGLSLSNIDTSQTYFASK